MRDGVATPIVLLTGPPGGGKSTIGRRVAEAFPRSVHIEADVVRESIVGGFVEPVFPFSDELIEQFALQREIVVEWAVRKAASGYLPVIDDAPIPPGGHFEQQYAPLLERAEVRPVILRADADVVRRRIEARGGRFDDFLLSVVDQALSMLDELDAQVWHTVDSTRLSIDETAAVVVACLDRR